MQINKGIRKLPAVTQKKLNAKGILFDLDGTIVDSKPTYLEAARAAFSAMGKETPSNSILLEIPKRLEQGMPIADLVGPDVKAFLHIYLNKFYSLTKSLTKPIPYMKATLETLRGRAKLALITMRFVPKSAVIEELHMFGLDGFFSYVVTAMDSCKPKPSPEALIAAVRALDVEICNCIVVGDSVVDVRAGKSAGAMTVSVLSGLYSMAELDKEKPDLILNDVDELPAVLDFTF